MVAHSCSHPQKKKIVTENVIQDFKTINIAYLFSLLKKVSNHGNEPSNFFGWQQLF